MCEFEIFKACVMLESERPPKPVDALFFYSRSFGDETGLFEIAHSLYQDNLIRYIVLPNTEGEREGKTVPFESNRGKTAYTKHLIQIGVDNEDILYGGLGKNTKTEGDGFISLAKEKQWNSATFIAQPHQILRAMLGLIKSMDEQKYYLCVYPVTPSNTPWQEVVYGSQGAEQKTREEHIRDEFNRIVKYQQQGDLASFEELFKYLKKRDSGQF